MCSLVVKEDWWRSAAYQMGISDGSQEAKQKAFSRCRTKLMEMELVTCWEGYYWKR
jgi:hypothetical protein